MENIYVNEFFHMPIKLILPKCFNYNTKITIGTSEKTKNLCINSTTCNCFATVLRNQNWPKIISFPPGKKNKDDLQV
jgi:hypothetical protein